MTQRGMFGRTPLLVAGALGLIAGAIVAHELTAPSALASDPPLEPVAAAPAPPPIVKASTPDAKADAKPTEASAPKPGIVFMDSASSGALGAPAVGTSTAPATPTAAGDPANPAARHADGAGTGGFLRTLAMLGLLAAGVIGWVIMRRRQGIKGGPNTPSLSLVGTIRIGGRWQVALVRVHGKVLVLGATDKGLTLLSEMDEDVIDPLVAPADRDELLRHLNEEPARDLETVSIGSRAAARAATEPGGFAPRPPEVAQPKGEPFTRLLEQLTRPATATRERIKTDDPQALRARLERHQVTG